MVHDEHHSALSSNDCNPKPAPSVAQKPRIFISHSTHDTDDIAVLTYLHELLSTSGFRVFVDKENLQTGDVWREKLIRELGVCDGAIVLLNEKALTSEWVKTEVNILRGRTWLEGTDANNDGFPLLPIRIGDVTNEQISKTWSALALTELQNWPKGNARFTAADLPNQALCAEILATLSPLLTRVTLLTPLEIFRNHIAELLRQVGWGIDLHARQAALELGVDEETTDRDPWCALADKLLEDGLTSQSIHVLFDVLGPNLSNERVGKMETLIDLLAPQWVHPVAASRLAESCRKTDFGSSLIFCINSKRQDFTAPHYIQRACFKRKRSGWKYVEVIPKQGTLVQEEVLEDIRQGLVQEFKKSFSAMRIPDPKDADIRERVKAWKMDKKQPVFAVLPQLYSLEAEIINTIGTRFPELDIICLTGEQATDASLAGRVHLEPPIKPEKEEEAYSHYLNALDSLPPEH